MKFAAIISAIIAPVIVFAALTNSKQTQEQKKTQPKAMGVYVTDEKGAQVSLHIQTLNVTTNVQGNLATTTMEMVVYNPHNRILEGQFSFPVSDGQTVSRFALDLHGKLRDAVVVDKSKARSTFEAIERKGVDPALLEWTRDNSFKTRIYPIMPKNSRRILIAYEQELSQGEDGLQYTLPITVQDAIDTFTWQVDVAAFGKQPSLSGNSTENVSFTNRGRVYSSTLQRNNVLIKEPFVIDIPVVPAGVVATVNTLNTEQYASVVVANPVFGSPTTARPLPKTIDIVWDASLSGAQRNLAKELEFFDQYFSKNPNVLVHLHLFAHEHLADSTFNIQGGNWSALKNTIAAIDYDGATQLSHANLATLKGELAFFVTDGISTFGAHQAQSCYIPLVGIISSTNADIDVVRSICFPTGGNVYDLRTTAITDVITSVFQQPVLVQTKVVSGTFEEIYPKGFTEAKLCNTIVGKLRSSYANLEVSYLVGNKVIATKDVIISAENATDSGLSAARMWAQQELRSLAGDRLANTQRIKSIGTEFSIVTPGTSLLVLENLSDYVQYNIQPPANEPELLQQWKTQIAQFKPYIQDSASRLQSLMAWVRERTDWYKTDWSKQPRKKTTKGIRVPQEGDPGVVITSAAMAMEVSEPVSRERDPLRPGASPNASENGSFSHDYWARPNKEANANQRSNNTGSGSGEGSAVVVIGEQKITATTIGRVSSNSEGNKMGKNSVAEMISTQAGVQATGNGFTIRGGRAEETQVLVDGMTVSDNFTGGVGNVGGVLGTPTDIRLRDKTIHNDLPDIAFEKAEPMLFLSQKDAKSVNVIDDLNNNSSSTNQPKKSKVTVPAHRIQERWTSELAKCTKENIYNWYLVAREKYPNNTGFFLDVSDVMRELGMQKEALRVLSNLAELEGENHQTLRILGHRLMQLGISTYATFVFEDVKLIRDEEPQSYRDLAHAYEANGVYDAAVQTLYKLAQHTWDSRFPGIEVIALTEMNRIISQHPDVVDTQNIAQQLRFPVASDVRIVLNWDADNCDMDLWVTDPTKEKCFYSNRKTAHGGRMSFDLTGGYGPEEYAIKHAVKGTYNVQVQFYGHRQQRITGPTTIQVELYTHYGTPQETKQTVTTRVSGVQQVLDIATLDFE